MTKTSAGILLYKFTEGNMKLFLVHPGGSFFRQKEEGWWGIPKGEFKEGEEGIDCAIRELMEETGIDVSKRSRADFWPLGEIQQKGGKRVHAWALEGDWSGLLICKSWVYMTDRNGRPFTFPEVDKAGFFDIEEGKRKMNGAQWELVERLEEMLKNKTIINA